MPSNGELDNPQSSWTHHITEQHVESILKTFLKYTNEIVKDLLEKNKSYIFMVGKAHLMVAILYLKVPDLIISVMDTRPLNINTSHKFISVPHSRNLSVISFSIQVISLTLSMIFRYWLPKFCINSGPVSEHPI